MLLNTIIIFINMVVQFLQIINFYFNVYINVFGSGALSGKMLLIRIFKINIKIDAYFRAG